MKKIIFILAFIGFAVTGHGQIGKHRGAFKPAAEAAVTYATWNPSDKDAAITLSGGDLTASGTTGYGSVRATGTVSGTQKKMFEITINTLAFQVVGVGNSSANLGLVVGEDINGWGMWQDDGNVIHNNASDGNNGASSIGQVIGVAVDMGTGTITYYRNGTLLGVSQTGLTGTLYPMWSAGGAPCNSTANFGATSFAYPVSGYTGFNL